ncbi:HEPN domain-containing protein [Caulobacter soli]|uniref:HEPN domain-containing protein n=1 Tax=Caulobacter soli TaxID=2708539 RepID=UPI0013ECD933|nr:HEPN domain-containing protein [Caulobacter soli]
MNSETQDATGAAKPPAPDRDVAKFLISSTCDLADRFQSPALTIAEALPGLRDRAGYQRRTAANGGRYAFTLAFRTAAADQGGVIIPTYEHVADMMCTYLAVLYGKRFDNHGALEFSGLFGLPNLRAMDQIADGAFPSNTASRRADLGFDLSLSQVARLTPLMFGQAGRSHDASIFRGAAKYYLRALQAAEPDIEVAYLHLITAGEILSTAIDIPQDQLLDAKTQEQLARIANELAGGAPIARAMRKKLRSVKARFVATFRHLVDAPFFDRAEAQTSYARLRREEFRKVLGAAYDLRSAYVHSGETFGDWVAPRGTAMEEVQSGRPMVQDKAFAKTLAAAPTFIGLERIVRYGLLRFAERLQVDTQMEPAAPAPERHARGGGEL